MASERSVDHQSGVSIMFLSRQAYQKTPISSATQRNVLEQQALESHLYLIQRSLNKYRGVVDPDTLDDLRQIALMAFILELRKFDHVINDDFLKSVTVRLKGAIIDELRARDYLSREQRSLSNKIKDTERKFMAKYGRSPTQADICSQLNISSEEYMNAIIDLTMSDDVELFELVNHADDSQKEFISLMLEKELKQLAPSIQKVLYFIYVMGLRTQETAQVLEISEMKVHRIKHKGIEIIRSRLGGH
ncbi:sigma-70 family RNA polymerase sigma factor [Vibrio furnissii]|nr:sigma-70 family RNA polymerase sigma factor [Vibrio furnissii]